MLIFNGLASWSSSKFGLFFVNVTMPRDLASADPKTGTQTAKVQVARIGAALPLNPFGDIQHLLSSAPPQQTALLQRTSKRIIRCLENRECLRLITGPCHPNFQLRSLCDKALGDAALTTYTAQNNVGRLCTMIRSEQMLRWRVR